MNGKDFATMSGPQLVEWFNAAVSEQPVKGFKPVAKFGSRERGIARCEALLAAVTNGKVEQEKTKADNDLLTEIVGNKRNTKKCKVAEELIKSEGRAIAATTLAKVVYGKADATALGAVVGGINGTLKKKKLGYVVKVIRNEKKEQAFGLFRTQ
jgi:hypothetical protein